MTLERKILQIVGVALLCLFILGYLSYFQAKYLINKQLIERDNVRDAKAELLLAHVHFKKQVQEWKNILLRGQDRADYEKYFSQFEIEEKNTQLAIMRYLERVNVNTDSATLAVKFLEAHSELAKEYRESLSLYKRDDEKSPFVTDNLVRGIDRGPSNLIDELVATTDQEAQQMIAKMQSDRAHLEAIIFAMFAALLIFGALFFFRVLHRWITVPVKSAIKFSNRIADGDFSKPLLIQASGDVNQLVQSLNKMQNALRSNYDKLLKANAALEAARDDALAATQAKSEFLANMSHEIRTPLNGVLGLTDMLVKSTLNQEQQSYVELLQASGASLLLLVNDILDISKIEKGVLAIKKEPFSPLDVVENAIKIVAESAEERALDYAFYFESSIPSMLVGDPLRVEQILVNLLNNAIKFTESGGVYIRIYAEQKHDYKVFLRFTVVDTGIGIEENKLTEIFERFQQVDASSSRSHGGAGLGLFISKQLAETMGGDLTACSQPGRGSEFCAELLLDRALETRFYLPKIDQLDNKHLIVISDRDFQNASVKSLMLNSAASLLFCRTVDELNFLQRHCDRRPVPDFIFVDSRIMSRLPYHRVAEVVQSVGKRHSYVIWLDAAGDDIEIAKTVFGILPHARIHRPIVPSSANRVLSELLRKDEVSKETPVPVLASSKYRAKFLVAEDNKVNQIIIAKVLENEGYTYALAENGRQAVDRALSEDFDCILMDCQMPIMDGYEATREIRNKERKVNYIVALTAHAMEGDKEKCINAGMDDYLTKPIKPNSFSLILEKLLKRRQRPPVPLKLV